MSKQNVVTNVIISGTLDDVSPGLDNNNGNVHPLDQSPIMPVFVHPDHNTAVHHRVADAGLAGRALASTRHGDSVDAKCNSDHQYESHDSSDPDNDHCGVGGCLSGVGLVCACDGGDGVVSGVTKTTFTPIVSSSA